jgi:putative phosphoribosyl transferase
MLEQTVSVPVSERLSLEGDLVVPDGPKAVVLFAHGSGSSRHSPRNRYVAKVLQQSGFATMLVDLLTVSEERAEAGTGQLQFDIELLAGRLERVTEWLLAREQTATRDLPLGYFGASTGAAAALLAAANRAGHVFAVVSRGGRPDLAGDALPKVRAATLLIVGSADTQVLELNRLAYARLDTEKRLEVVPGATHLFEEPGALEQVAALAARWFEGSLAALNVA